MQHSLSKSTCSQSMELFAEINSDHFIVPNTLHLTKASFHVEHSKDWAFPMASMFIGVLLTACKLTSVLKGDGRISLNVFF